MDRKITKANWELKYSKAIKALRAESRLGNYAARASLCRFGEIEQSLINARDVLKADPQDFIKKELIVQLEAEKKHLINESLRKGWPKQFLKNLFEKRKAEQHPVNNSKQKKSNEKAERKTRKSVSPDVVVIGSVRTAGQRKRRWDSNQAE